MIRMKRDAQSLDEFLADCVPVKEILWGEEQSRLMGDADHLPTHCPVVLLDITGHLHVNITDLARVYQTDVPGGESATEYAVDFWIQPDHFLVRLIFSYQSPVILEFAIVFRCLDPNHWIFLRWLAENDGVVVLADEFAGPASPHSARKTLLIETDIAEELGAFLCSLSLRLAKTRKKQRLTGLEMITALLEARRFISFEDIAANALTSLGMPIQGKEQVQLKTLQGQRIPYAKISRPFQRLLLQVVKHKNVGIILLDGVLYLVRSDYAQEMGYTQGSKNVLPHETFEEFTAGTILVEHIVDAKSLQTGSDVVSMPVASLDLSSHPTLKLGDLTESNSEFTWAVAETSDDILIRLTCILPTQFALCFRLSLHKEFLRWVLEHENRVPLAEKGTGTLHVLSTKDEDLVGSLRLMCIHQMLGRTPHPPDQEEMMRMLFDVKRALSLQELAIFANELFHIQVRGNEEQMIQDAFGDPGAALLVREISRDFRVLLLQALVLDGIVSGLYQGAL